MLAEAVDIRRWLREDHHTPFSERLERDRAIGRELTAADPVARVLAWWTRVAGPDEAAPEARAVGARVVALRRVGSLALLMLGLVLGSAVAGVAFAYDGRYPVNLFTLLGVLVGLPLLLLVLTLLLLPGRLPVLGALQAVAAGMNLGRWLGVWLDRLAGATLFAPTLVGGGAGSRFSRWQLVVFSQWLAVGFFAGVLVVAMLLVTFTDLAFGWSTTLDVDASLVTAAVATLAAPWAGWLPWAAPDAALVEASRYVRLEHTALPAERALALGAWWPFVLMTIVTYGALPRLLLLTLASWRLHAATRALLLDDPEVTALLDRLEAPLVALGGGDEPGFDAGEPEALPGPAAASAGEPALLVIWNQAAAPAVARNWLAQHLGLACGAVLELGILQPEAARRGQLAAAAAAAGYRRVVVVTKGWEPPLLEFSDFLAEVREALGAACSVTVVPLALGGGRVEADERDVWARALARNGDGRLYVAEAVP